MFRRTLVPVLALLLAAAVPAIAESPFDKGSHDLSLEVSPDFEGVTGDTIDVEAGYGYFLRDKLALRAALRYATIEDVAPGEKDYRRREVTLGLEYQFWRSGHSVVPYAGVELGYARLNYLDFDASGAVGGLRGGVKILLSPHVAIDFTAAYTVSSENVFVNDFVPEDSDLTYGIGLRAMF